MALTNTTPPPAETCRAYGGPAHGRCWPLEADAPPPALELVPGLRYWLIHHPRTHQPARDHLGNYLYMSVSHLADGHPISPPNPDPQSSK